MGRNRSNDNRMELEATWRIESAPNPIKATLPASMPTVTPIIASSDVQVILRYSTRRPARVCRTRSSSSVMTVSCTSELNAIILPCCLEKSSPHARWSAGVDDGKGSERHHRHRGDLTAQAGIY